MQQQEVYIMRHVLMEPMFFSETLKQGVTITVLLPQKMSSVRGDIPPHQTMYLLCGGSEDHSFMLRNSMIERWIRGYNVAVVMPFVAGRYKLANLGDDEQWWDFYSQELPEVCRNMFKLSDKREDTFAVGGSGGGFAALKLGLLLRDKIGYVGAVHPALFGVRFGEYLNERAKLDREKAKLLREQEHKQQAVEPKNDPKFINNDVFEMLKEAADKNPKPALHLSCGREDNLYGLDVEFRDLAVSLGYDPVWFECTGGHDEGFFNPALRNILDWLPLQKLATW